MTGARRREYLREDLHQRLTFQVEIRPGVGHGRIQRRMPEPLADRRKVDPGLQQKYGRRVSQGLRVIVLSQGADCCGSRFDALLEQVADAEASINQSISSCTFLLTGHRCANCKTTQKKSVIT